MLVTFGIEKDDTSDGDYLPGEEDEEILSDCWDAQSAARMEFGKKEPAATIDKDAETAKAVKGTVKMMKNSVKEEMEAISSKSEHKKEVLPTRKKRKVEEIYYQSDYSACGDDDKSERLEYMPRKRSSNNIEELHSMVSEQDKITNVVPPFPSKPIESWGKFESVLKEYKRKNNLKFRVRTSETTALYNRSHDHQIPTDFQWTHKVYRCTHGVSQESRS
ncbi:hypothetical protein F444_20584 [Phytophthora nicotianae P1976]|uniref:ZSWIM3 N-terminal domain-containing protein n=1 Tax=Phytophthora nicotianae P1976 TaxID=1317066 RepID=A0A080Z447_PHYNI|nr:hypothetical protein F444_20584 [Phytophthora nicotianae P1976]